eukprot:4279714-Amphidinium_carterae.1
MLTTAIHRDTTRSAHGCPSMRLVPQQETDMVSGARRDVSGNLKNPLLGKIELQPLSPVTGCTLR